MGRYKEGWRYYEARFNCPDFDDVCLLHLASEKAFLTLLELVVRS